VSATAPAPIGRLLAPLREFSSSSAAGGIVLLVAALIALLWSNSPFHESYDALWHTPLVVGFGAASLELDLQHWVNDGLMAIFFLLVGLEIKRELLVGELASPRRALLPAAAALGGAVIPALIFLGFTGASGEAARGWGVPMATDIAFALGVLALLGSRVPLGLRIFVTALAIVDDLIAVLVIALFYTSQLSFPALAAAGAILVVLVAANRLGVNRPGVYAALGLLLWLAVLGSGVHATVAGVLLAATIPARQRVVPNEFVEAARDRIDEFERSTERSLHHRHAALWELESVTQNAQAPMLRIEHALSTWVAFVIVPIFALANAGVRIDANVAALLADPIVLGVVFGLIVGKQVGITGATWLIVRSGLASLPVGVGLAEIYGAAWVCGIGFTMSLFVADLAYTTPEALASAKVGILAASLIAGVGGYLLLRRVANPAPERRAAVTERAD
jgi:Na+:H+ antiporter, NhaA family